MEITRLAALAARAIAGIVAPRYCVVCGEPSSALSPWPLCDGCALALEAEARAAAAVERCSSCGKPLVSERGRCVRCRSSEYSFGSAYPLVRYAGKARSTVLAYKSGRRRSLAGFFAMELARALASRYPGRTVVPVPPRPGKMRRKGWDQVEDIARILERRYGVPVARVLTRSDGVEQKALGLEGRAANMKGAVGVKRGALVPLEPVVLDDVLTTGATLSACASALRSAGAARVDALTIAAD